MERTQKEISQDEKQSCNKVKEKENLRRFRFRPRILLNQIPIFNTNFISAGCHLRSDKKVFKYYPDMLFISSQLTEQKGKIGLLWKSLQ